MGDWDVVGEAPAGGAPAAGAWDVVDEQPTQVAAAAPATPQAGGQPSPQQLQTMIEYLRQGQPNHPPEARFSPEMRDNYIRKYQAMLPAGPGEQPGPGERFIRNAREGLDGTLTGEVINYNQSGQADQAQADDLFRAIVEARRAGSPTGLETFEQTEADRTSKFPGLHQPKPSPYAGVPLPKLEEMFNVSSKAAGTKQAEYQVAREADQAEFQALPSFADAPTLWGKVSQGAAALGGQLAGGAPSPENLIGGPGGRIVREVGEGALRYGARKILPGLVEGAAGGGVANPIVQQGKVERGEQDGFSAGELGESVLLGGGVGGTFRLTGMAFRAVRDAVARRRGVDPNTVTPDSVTPDDFQQTLKDDPQLKVLIEANGIVSPDDPRVGQLQGRLEARRTEEAMRPNPDNLNEGMKTQEAEIGRRQNEGEKTAPDASLVSEEGTINKGATNAQPRAPDDRTIMVDREGGAYRADPGAEQGRAKAEVLERADQKALPAPGRAVPTDEEIARTRAETEGGQRPSSEAPDTLYGQENPAPQSRDAMVQDRQAGEAFDLAQRQRERAGGDVRDTQVAGRPEGRGDVTVHLDEGHPVEIVDRQIVQTPKGPVDMATVRRYDPRTGQAAADAVEYQVPARNLKTSQYSPEPRMAQDFEARADVGRVDRGRARGQRIDEVQGLDRQTYRTTPPDVDANTGVRAARPEQPAGPHPGRRWSTTEEAMRDFAQRQQSQQQSAGPQPGNKYEKAKSSNTAREPGADSRFHVDESGFIMSDAQGPIRFADQKQAARWILNVGQKRSPDQIFEIAVHPTGKGFTARETGRTQPPPGGEKSASADRPQADTSGGSIRPQADRLAGPRAEAPQPEARTPAQPEAPPKPRPSEPPPRPPEPPRVEPEGPRVASDFADAVKAEREAIFGENRRWKQGYSSRERVVDSMAVERVMRREAAAEVDGALRDNRINDGDVQEIAQFYGRRDGETPTQAFDRAADEWADRGEQAAMRDLNTEHADLSPADFYEPARDVSVGSWRTPSGRRDLGRTDATEGVYWDWKEGKYVYREAPTDHEIPFEAGASKGTGGTVPPEGGAGPRGAGRDAAERGSARADGEAGREFTVDPERDGWQQTVIPGAERITDRERAQRGSDERLRGGNERPPAGGLFDEDARNQTTLFSNPFASPEAWASLGRTLGFTSEYVRDLKQSFAHWCEARTSNDHKKTNALADMARTYLYSVDGEMRAVAKAYNSPTIKAVADSLFAPADMGRGGAVSRTYHEAVDQRTLGNLNKLGETLKPFVGQPETLSQIRYLAQNPANIKRGSKIHDAAAAVRKMLDDEFAYLKDAGVDVGKIEGYFPRIVDATRVLKDQNGFIEAAAKQYIKDGIAKNRDEAGELAQAWLASVELGHAGARKDGTDFVMLGGTPNSDFRKERVFGRSIERDETNPLRKYYLQDPIDTLTLHFQRTARRAEWARRFGDDLQKWKDTKKAIIDEGNVASLRQVVDGVAAATGVARAYHSDATKAAISTIRTWGALRLLPRATITSLSEVAMPAIRSGNGLRMLGDMVNTVRALTGGMKGDRELAADLGLISEAIGDSILGRRYFALETGSKVQQDIVNRYFRRTGLEQFTNATRVVAVAAGQTFIRRLASDVETGTGRKASSTTFLRELGINDAPAFAKWVMATNDGRPSLGDLQVDKGQSAQYRTAFQRFNQQASLNPNSSTRPGWASQPVGSLFFMLQSYAYAFQKQVLNRTALGAVEAVAGKGYTAADRATMLAPAMLLPALVAIQYGLADVRDDVFGDPTAKKKDEGQKFMQVLSRSGLNGILDPYMNMTTGARYDRDAATAIAGPAVGGLTQLVDQGLKLAVRNSDNTNTTERNFAKAFYDATLWPAAAAAASFLPGPLGAAAIQGASSGTAREAFTSEVAGPKKPEKHGPPRPPRPKRPPH